MTGRRIFYEPDVELKQLVEGSSKSNFVLIWRVERKSWKILGPWFGRCQEMRSRIFTPAGLSDSVGGRSGRVSCYP